MGNDWLNYCQTFIPQIKARHHQMLGRECNIENPSRFTDKLEWLKIYDSTFLKTYCSDKLTARKYVVAKIGRDISFPVLGIYDKFDDIIFSKLPKNYIIKTNHASHTNIIVRNGNINKTYAKKMFSEWMGKDMSWYGYELHYIPIPRKIFIEPLMNDGHSDLIDYKIYMFNGLPKFCQVITNRNTHEEVSHYDMNWNYAPMFDQVGLPSISTITRPKSFNTMIQYAVELAKPFKFVRVDFYEIDGQCYFGELTFIPAAAYLKYNIDSIDYKLGEMLSLQ